MPTLMLHDVPEELYRRIEQLAAAERVPMAEETVRLLRQALNWSGPEARSDVLLLLEQLRRTAIVPRPGTPDSVQLLREDRAPMTAPLVCVVDTSVAVKLYLAEPLAAEAHALFGRLADPTTIFHVPDLFYIECANVLWKQVQRGGAAASVVAAHYAAVSALPLQRTATFELAAEALDIAATHGITAYDACYVVLGHRQGIPVITADDRLVNKLAGSGYAVVWLGAWTPPAPTT